MSNLFLRHWDWHSNNLLNYLLYDSLLKNHLGYVHDLLHLLRNKDVNIIFVLHDGDDGDWRLHDGDMMVTMVIGNHGDEQAPLLDSSLRNDLRKLNDSFNDLLNDR